MDEIVTSIRRIVSNDASDKDAQPSERLEADAEDPLRSVAFGDEHLAICDLDALPVPALRVYSVDGVEQKAAAPKASRSGEPLVLPETDPSARTGFHSLAPTVTSPPVEEVVREILRPMLRMWLDDNLPTLVERLVRAEIERVARGGR